LITNGADLQGRKKDSLQIPPPGRSHRLAQGLLRTASQRHQRPQHPRTHPPPLPQGQRTRRPRLQLAALLLLHQPGRQKIPH